jgi:hypothetical protein
MWVDARSLVAVNVGRKRRCSQAERFMISSRYSYGPAFSMPDYDHPELKRDDKGATKTARRGC